MIEPTEIKNAKITSANISLEDHGILTCYLMLDYGGSGQGFGGYALDGYNKALDKRVGTAWGMEYIRRLIELFDVEHFANLKGLPCRVEASYDKILRIGHFIDDEWFYPKEDLNFLMGDKNP